MPVTKADPTSRRYAFTGPGDQPRHALICCVAAAVARSESWGVQRSDEGCAANGVWVYAFTAVLWDPGLFAVKATNGSPAEPNGLSGSFPGRDLPMALFMYQVSYTSEAVAALIREPQDRAEAVRPAIEALGGKLVAAGYPMGEYDAIVLFEAPDDTSAAAFALAIAAGGAAKSAKTTRLLSGQEWIESLRKAQGSQYRPPR